MKNTPRYSLVMTILADILELDYGQIDDDLSSRTCEAWDSIRHVSVILAVEAALDIRFDERKLADLMSLKSLMAALDEILPPPPSAA